MTDVASLLQAARAWVAIVDGKPADEWIRGYVLDGINYVEDLCDALEGEEKEVERLREQVTRLDAYITHRDYDREILDENARLRQQLKICAKALDKACRETARKDRNIATLQRKVQRLPTLVNDTERLRDEVGRLNGIIAARGGKWIPGAARRSQRECGDEGT